MDIENARLLIRESLMKDIWTAPKRTTSMTLRRFKIRSKVKSSP